jgi:hypothetical protein
VKITFPAFKKWLVNCRNSRKIVLTRNEALIVSVMLEQLKLTHWDKNWKPDIRKMEDVIDAQIWGKHYVDNRR